MPMTCTIDRLRSTDPELLERIEEDLIAGVPLRIIAKQRLGDSSRYQALGRHKRVCMAERLVAAGVTRIEETKAKLDEFDTRMDAAFGLAMQGKDVRGAVAATAEQRKQLEFVHKLDGDLQSGTTINVLVASPEWARLRTAMLDALEPFPEAKAAVLGALAAAVDGLDVIDVEPEPFALPPEAPERP